MSVQVIRVGDRRAAVAVPVGAAPGGPVSAAARPTFSQLADVDTTHTPADTPLVLRRGSDGVYRPEPVPTLWGDPIRYRPGAPTDLDAPTGAVHIDTTTGRGFRLRNLED